MVLKNRLCLCGRSNRSKIILLAASIVTLYLFSAGAYAMLLGDSAKGKTIHDAKCLACHTAQFKDPTQVYLRSPRRVNSVEGLMQQVEFCNKQIDADLNEEEINDVVNYLNEAFYKFKE